MRRPGRQAEPALTYTVISPQTGLKTSAAYVQYIISGLRQHNIHNIDAAYVAHVKSIAAANNPAIATDVAKM